MKPVFHNFLNPEKGHPVNIAIVELLRTKTKIDNTRDLYTKKEKVKSAEEVQKILENNIQFNIDNPLPFDPYQMFSNRSNKAHKADVVKIVKRGGIDPEGKSLYTLTQLALIVEIKEDMKKVKHLIEQIINQ